MKKNRFLSTLILACMVTMLAATPAFAKTVCKIGSKGYSSLQAAVDAVKDGQTIKVTKSIKTDEMVSTSHPGQDVKKFTIDFKNKKYSYDGYDYAFNIEGPKRKITFKNINFNVRRGFTIGGWGENNRNTLVVQNGKYVGGPVNNGGYLEIKGGTYQFKGTIDSFLINKGTATVNDGTFTNCNIDNYGTCNLKGGKWTNKYRVAQYWNYPGGIMTVSGGEYNGGNTFYYEKGSKLTIKGGTINISWHLTGAGTLTITGGTFNKVGDNKEAMVSPAGVANIKGGTFNGMIAAINTGKITIDGGTSTGCLFALDGGEITINKMNVNTKMKNDLYGYQDPICLIAQNGSIKVNGGSFTCADGYGYTQSNGGKVTFGVGNPASLFKVKTLELK